MLNYALFNNQVLEKDKIKITPFDRGLIFGDGVFTTLLVEDGRPIFFYAHQRRLHKQAKDLGIKAPLISIDTIKTLIEQNKAERGHFKLKICITGGSIEIKGFKKRRPGCLIGYMEEFQPHTHPLKLTLYPKPIESPSAKFKTLAYLDRFLIMDWTKSQGFDECLIVDAKLNILEALFANIFWIYDEVFFYPDPQLDLVQGITIKILQKKLQSIGLRLMPVQSIWNKIPEKANVFLANSLVGFSPVVYLQKQKFSRNLILERQITASYQRIKELY